MEKGLVTVGIPTFNRAGVLSRAVDSVLSQTYAHLEVIVADNASTDETSTICERYAAIDPRVRYVRHLENAGATANFVGIPPIANGEFFLWLADDDWIDPTYVEECVAVLAVEQDVQLVSGQGRYVLDGECVFKERAVDFTFASPLQRVSAYVSWVGYNTPFYGVVRTSVLSLATMRDRLGADWAFVAQILCSGKIRMISSVSINRSLGGASGDLAQMAHRAGLGSLLQVYPHIDVARTIALALMARSGPAAGFSYAYRFVLSAVSVWHVLRRFVIWPRVHTVLSSLRIRSRARRAWTSVTHLRR